MNQNFSQLSLTDLCDKLSECTALYSRSMLNGFSEKEFAELRQLIEALQAEIERRKTGGSNSVPSNHTIFPLQNSASA